MSITARSKNALQHAFAKSYVERTNDLEFAEVDDEEGLLVLGDWIGFDEDESTWKSNDNIWRNVLIFRKKYGECAQVRGFDCVCHGRMESAYGVGFNLP